MKESLFEQRLLALHYVHPVPLNKIQPLLDADPELRILEKIGANELAHLLKLPADKARRIADLYKEVVATSFQQAYRFHGIIPIPFNHEYYPSLLHELVDPPAVLYVKGKLEYLVENWKIAVIGSRKATSYTERAMETIIPPLVEHNMVIVSGLAKGADTMAHHSAIKYGGKTIAVLGSGHFHIYPKENTQLAEYLSTNHLLLTEYPPYTGPKRWQFPMRNRIISGLSNGVVVTEAAKKSGTLSTMEHALEHGKDIFAVPGPIHSELSLGPHQLLLEGAKPVWNGYQIVEETIQPKWPNHAYDEKKLH